ncbi:MAG: peptide deformylase [Kineosporiaceae bacterium]
MPQRRIDYRRESRQRPSRTDWDRGQVRQIRVVGDPVLRSPCDEVREVDDGLRRLVDDMFASMYASDGVGLAANQVGVGRRVFVVDCPDDDGVWHRAAVVNPVVTAEAGDLVEDAEGCLSIPGFATELARPASVTVRGRDPYGAAIELSGRGFLARCLRHESDHLDGRLFTDLVTGPSRRAALRAIRDLSACG